MIQGTTPVHIFEIPFNVDLIQKVKITYAQQGKVILEKQDKELTLEKNTITAKLTQEDTFLFLPMSRVSIQVRVITKGGEALATIPQSISVIECLDGEVLK